MSTKQKKIDAELIRELLSQTLSSKIAITPELERNGIKVPEELNEQDETTYMALLVHRLILQAITGDNKAQSEILDRLMGKAPQYQETVNVEMNYVDFLKTCRDTQPILTEDTETKLLEMEDDPLIEWN